MPPGPRTAHMAFIFAAARGTNPRGGAAMLGIEGSGNVSAESTDEEQRIGASAPLAE
jgi:hypothetical protein